jgi:hypothetical protein
MRLAMEAQRAAWVKSAMVQMSGLLPEPHFAGAQVDQEGSAERKWGSEPEMLSHFSPRLLFAVAKTVQVGSAAMRRGSKMVLGRSGWGGKKSVLVVTVERQAVRDCGLGSARMPALGLVAMATELEEVACAEGRQDVARRPSQHPSATPPRSAFLPLSSYASLVGARGSAGTRVVVVGAVADQPAGARAGSVGLGVCPLSGRGGLLKTGVSSELTTVVSSELTTGISSELTAGVSSELTTGVRSELTNGVSSKLTTGLAAN